MRVYSVSLNKRKDGRGKTTQVSFSFTVRQGILNELAASQSSPATYSGTCPLIDIPFAPLPLSWSSGFRSLLVFYPALPVSLFHKVKPKEERDWTNRYSHKWLWTFPYLFTFDWWNSVKHILSFFFSFTRVELSLFSLLWFSLKDSTQDEWGFTHHLSFLALYCSWINEDA